MTTGTGVVASCTDAVSSDIETCCTGSETAKTAKYLVCRLPSGEVVAVGAGVPTGGLTLSGIGHTAAH